ncbi:MAG: hypothetical protein RMY16_23395 [Nostoc sp. DedQUE12b]|uniref:hypothetical protein n=1 Tax=Nostoc sp. DedQUE12b TaxID=3075398 RepID=UPI002AD3C155|nr:hypothetical protein [Nostoc sp. DedQUE12b]MDZ8088481.1 hypothetical protein [Nostoc sp. DedQUE12b]
MNNPVTPDMLVGLENAPEEVKNVLSTEPRQPEKDPTLGIPVSVNREGSPRHRLVTIGDSLTHGFQSGAIFNTKLSYPMLIAREMGWDKNFRYPTYASPGDGLPMNLERLVRELSNRFQVADGINALDIAFVVPWLSRYLNEIENYWERGQGKQPPVTGLFNHNLAVYGWDLRNTLSRTADIAKKVIQTTPPKDNTNFLQQTPENANEIATLRVLNNARDSLGKALTPLEAAIKLSHEGNIETGQGDGIETLIILIGANNALGSILTFHIEWSGKDFQDMATNDKYTVWLPSHFKAELDMIVEKVKQIKARHVIWGTVPHVTIAPFARGINKDKNGQKVKVGSRYFPYYAPFWFNEETFDSKRHPHLTANQARAIDSVIDGYNKYIVDAVREGREQGKDWYLFETVALLDRLAVRRYIEDKQARPNWWTEYTLPPAIDALRPKPDSQFFKSNSQGRLQGGLFSLDGIHPTTIGYGIMAQEIIKIMQLAGVKFYQPDGVNERKEDIQIDFKRLIEQDTLISQPPTAVSAVLDFVGWLDTTTNVISQMYRASL